MLTIGPRILKTGISVTLALYICYFFQLEPSVFAGVAAIFAIQPSIYRTWKHVLDQLTTNTLGALIALFASHLLGTDPIIIGLVMIIVILVSLQLKMESTISLTVVTVLAIMSVPESEDLFYAINRFIIILIGIGSSFIVNILIYPPKYKNNYLDRSERAFQSMSLLMRTAVSDELTEKSFHEDFDSLDSDIRKLEDLFNIFNEEREKMSKLNPLDAREMVVFKQMLRCLQQGEEVLELIDEYYFQSKRNIDMDRFFDQRLEDLIMHHEYLLLKYKGKIKNGESRTENDVLKDSGVFLENILAFNTVNHEDKQRFIIIGSSILEYTLHLQRLNKLIEQYLKTN